MGILGNIRKDFLFLARIGRALARVTPMARKRTRTFPDVMDELAEKFADRLALISDRESFTYAELNRRGNRYAHWARDEGLAKDEVVCLLMPNRPEFVAIWLGIIRAGGTAALLNTNLTGAALAHCVNLVAAKHIIVAAELAKNFMTAQPLVTGEPKVWIHGECEVAALRLDEAISAYSETPLEKEDRPALTLDDRALLIYTSGTTGLPKAAKINHYRVLAAMDAFSAIMHIRADDRLYNCLPLYHTSGGVIAICAPLREGASVFIREKFSARQFWDDVVERECTLFQYIGELCRYLVNAPPHAKERSHKLRLCCGNGLRPDIWETFGTRFGIREIREFYAATEGNAILFNLDNTPGAVGRVPGWAHFIFPLRIIAFDIDKEEPIRDANGFCRECKADEIGEVVSQILISALKPGQRFDGYSDQSATEKKILRDAFAKGDMWFRSGDLMRRDGRGYFFFVDRIGDTFRWKGENVATSEVAELINTFDAVKEANVYGVPVDGREGKAGMVAIVADPSLDLVALRQHIHGHLSAYSRPLFIRLQREIDSTSTFKQRKADLVRDGFDPSKVSDPLYFDEAAAGAYVPIDAELYRRIQAGELRV
jgi:fatty-acyl-CoA synthase